VAVWLLSNRLQLSAAKAEVLWCSSSRRVSQLSSDSSVVMLFGCGSWSWHLAQ